MLRVCACARLLFAYNLAFAKELLTPTPSGTVSFAWFVSFTAITTLLMSPFTLMSAAAVEHCNAVQRHLRRTYACDDDLVVRRRRTSYSVFGMRRNASMCSRINSCVSHKLQQCSTREFTNVVDVTLGGWVGCSGAVEWLNGCTYHIISGIKYL